MSARNITFAVVCIIGVLLDQLTKAWVVANVELHYGAIPIIPGFLSIVHEQNEGAAFSSFSGMQGMFMVFTIIAVIVLIDLARRLPADALYMSATLGMIMSGAIGNAIDRVRFQRVTDFIRVYTDDPALRDWLVNSWVGTNTYPIFNVADSAILVGVVLFLIHSMFLEEAEVEPEDEVEEDESEDPDAEDPDAEDPDAEDPDAEDPDADDSEAEDPDADDSEAEDLAAKEAAAE
jgi:signal peptidase II